jgi:TusA-related sulfurtransferase
LKDIPSDAQIDVTGEVCPMTLVYVKVALEELASGGVLNIRLNDGEPAQNLPKSLALEGHEILKLNDNGDGTYCLWLKKA